MIDDTDRRILSILQEDARTSNAEIARTIELAPSAVYQRIRKLEESGVISGYAARIDPRALGLDLLAFVMVRTNENARDVCTVTALRDIPQVLEIHRVVGEDCFVVKVRVTGPEALANLLDHQIREIPSVAATRTVIALRSHLEHGPLPIDAREEAFA